MTFSPDGRSLAVATPGKAETGQLADGSYRNFGRIVDRIDLLDLASGKRKSFEVGSDTVTSMAFAPDGNVLALGGGWANPMIRLYRTTDGREIGSFACPARIVHAGALTFSPDGRSLAAGLDDTTVLVWDVSSIR